MCLCIWHVKARDQLAVFFCVPNCDRVSQGSWILLTDYLGWPEISKKPLSLPPSAGVISLVFRVSEGEKGSEFRSSACTASTFTHRASFPAQWCFSIRLAKTPNSLYRIVSIPLS